MDGIKETESELYQTFRYQKCNAGDEKHKRLMADQTLQGEKKTLKTLGQAWCLTSVIPALQEAKGDDCLSQRF